MLDYTAMRSACSIWKNVKNGLLEISLPRNILPNNRIIRNPFGYSSFSQTSGHHSRCLVVDPILFKAIFIVRHRIFEKMNTSSEYAGEQ